MFPQVVGQTFQSLENVSPRTYIGSGKTLEVEGAVDELEADTVIFDDELTPGIHWPPGAVLLYYCFTSGGMPGGHDPPSFQ